MFNNLLISAPNLNGGLFFVKDNQPYRLDHRPTTGLFWDRNFFARSIQSKSVKLYDKLIPKDAIGLENIDDIHDILLFDDHLYLVKTYSNEILKFSTKGELVQRWTFPGESDSWHINCLCEWNGEVYFSAFGEFAVYRGYKGASAGAGFVQNLLTGKRSISGLSEPHSPIGINQDLLVANSKNQELIKLSSSGNLLASVKLEGYTRGIAVSNHIIYVGISASRNLDEIKLKNASIVALDLTSFEVISKLELPFDEVYDIFQIDSESHMLPIILDISSSSICEISENNLTLTSSVHKLNQELEERGRWGLGLDDELAKAREKIAELNQELEERGRWVLGLDDELAKAREKIAELNQELSNTRRELHGVWTNPYWRATLPLREVQKWISSPRKQLNIYIKKVWQKINTRQQD
jgi:hypothetical protein